MHRHLIPDFYREALAAHDVTSIGGVPVPAWSPTLAVDFINRQCVQTQVASVSEAGVTYLPSAEERVAMAQRLNTYTSGHLAQSTWTAWASSAATAERIWAIPSWPL